MRLDPASIKIQGVVGSTFTVDVLIEGVTDLGGFAFAIRFDDAILNLVGIRDGPFLSSGGGSTNCVVVPPFHGLARLGCLLKGKPGVSGSGVAGELDFSSKIPFSVPDQLELLLMNCEAADSQGNLIALNGCKDGVVEINAVPPAVGGVSLDPLGPALGSRQPAGHEDSWRMFVTLVASGAFVVANGTWLAYRRWPRNASRS